MCRTIDFIYRIIIGLLVFTLVVKAQKIRGTPGEDYPNYFSIPKTSFSCAEQKYIPGFYADIETNCQAFHLCFKNREESFLCPTGTIFNQAKLACDNWYSSNCTLAPSFYNVNAGPVMESAEKNIPTILKKLRNLPQSKSSAETPAANIQDKLAPLHGSANDAMQSDGTETSDPTRDESVEYSQMISDSNSNGITKVASEGVKHALQSQEDILDGIDVQESDIQDDFELEGYYTDGLEENADEEIEDTENNILYDPVTEKYYVDYDWQQDSENANDQFKNFYGYENPANRYGGLMFQDYIGGSLGDSEREESVNEVESSDELDEVNSNIEAENSDFSRRLLSEQVPKRTRRRPMYIVVRDDDEQELKLPNEFREVGLSKKESDEMSLAESTSSEEGETSTRFPLDLDTEIDDVDETFDVEEVEDSRRSEYSARENASEEPLTSEQFEQAILSELVNSKLSDQGQSEREQLESNPEHGQMYEEQSEYGGREFQNDGQSFENVAPGSYESVIYDLQDGEMENQETSTGMYENPNEEADWYQTEETTVAEDSVEGETFVVIPDESEDGGSDEYLGSDQMPDNADSLDRYTYESTYGDEQEVDDQNDAACEFYNTYGGYLAPNYKYPGRCGGAGPYKMLQTQQFERVNQPYPEGYYNPINRESLRSQYELSDGSSYVASDAATNYAGYPGVDSSGRYMSDSSVGAFGPYAYVQQPMQQPMSYLEYMYGTENGYSYENPYTSYPGENAESLGYEVSDDSIQSAAGGVPGEDFNLNQGYYVEPKVPTWVEKDKLEGGDSLIPMEENFNSYGDIPFGSEDSEKVDSDVIEDNAEDVSLEETDKTDETYYVIDIDEDAEEQTGYEPDVEDPENDLNDTDQIDVQEKSLHSDESLAGKLSVSDAGEKSLESSEIVQGNELTPVNEILTSQHGEIKSSDSANSQSTLNENMRPISDQWNSYATEGSLINEKPVTLSSALERLAGLRVPQTSDAGNVDFSSENKFMSGMAFPESMDFGPYGYGSSLGQQYGMMDSMSSNKAKKGFSHRTGESEKQQLSKISALQERIRSMKQGKFGTFKKYMSSMGNRKD